MFIFTHIFLLHFALIHLIFLTFILPITASYIPEALGAITISGAGLAGSFTSLKKGNKFDRLKVLGLTRVDLGPAPRKVFGKEVGSKVISSHPVALESLESLLPDQDIGRVDMTKSSSSETKPVTKIRPGVIVGTLIKSEVEDGYPPKPLIPPMPSMPPTKPTKKPKKPPKNTFAPTRGEIAHLQKFSARLAKMKPDARDKALVHAVTVHNGDLDESEVKSLVQRLDRICT